jgi:hypothetical protein
MSFNIVYCLLFMALWILFCWLWISIVNRMASTPIDVLPVEGGFVATAEVVRAEAAPVADVAAATTPAARPMR